MDKQTNFKSVLQKIDCYISILRHSYVNSEKLQRLEKIKDYFNKEQLSKLEEKVTCKIEYAEQLSNKIVLPLKVRGVFLLEGRPKRKYYTVEEMKLAVENEMNNSFPLCLDHKDTLVDKIVGKVDKIEFDESVNGIRFYGHVNSEIHARNILDGVITDVSATIYSDSDYSDKYGIMASNLVFKELSLVWTGSVSGNYVEAY